MVQPRTKLVAYRSSMVTPDTAEALRRLEIAAAKHSGVRIQYEGVRAPDTRWDSTNPGPTACPPEHSMRPTGREVYLRLVSDRTDYENLALLWSIAVPLGFTPWKRHLVPGPGDEVFHYMGVWRSLYDSLCASGRGEEAWSSVCCAAQVDVGTWEGDRFLERFVQAQLHRLGVDVGPIDGIIGERTTKALRELVGSGTLEEKATALSRFPSPSKSRSKTDATVGYVILPVEDAVVLSYGGVASTKTTQGYALSITGPGKAIIDIGGGG